MNDTEKVFRDRLKNSLGVYCPNITALNQMSEYLFKEACKVIYDCHGTDGSIESFVKVSAENGNLEINKLSFIHAVKDFSVFSSQHIMIEALKKAVTDVKNTIPMVKREEVIRKSKEERSNPYQNKKQSSSVNVVNQNEVEADIDTSSIPKTRDILKGVLPQADLTEKSMQVQNNSNVFDGDIDMDFDDINQMTIHHDVSDEEPKAKEMMTDGSAFTEESYNDVPSVNIDLNY